MGVERTPNKSKHRKLTLEKKILLPLLPGFELTTFQSRVRRSTKKLSNAITLKEKIIFHRKVVTIDFSSRDRSRVVGKRMAGGRDGSGGRHEEGRKGLW